MSDSPSARSSGSSAAASASVRSTPDRHLQPPPLPRREGRAAAGTQRPQKARRLLQRRPPVPRQARRPPRQRVGPAPGRRGGRGRARIPVRPRRSRLPLSAPGPEDPSPPRPSASSWRSTSASAESASSTDPPHAGFCGRRPRRKPDIASIVTEQGPRREVFEDPSCKVFTILHRPGAELIPTEPQPSSVDAMRSVLSFSNESTRASRRVTIAMSLPEAAA